MSQTITRPAANMKDTSAAPLFQPFEMQDLPLRNRIMMPALTRVRADNPGLVPTELMALYYAQRASAGLIVSEGTWVSPQAIGINDAPGIFSPEQTKGWRLVTDAVHAAGGKIFAQLWHTGALSHPDYWNGEAPLGASAVNPKLYSRTVAGWQETITPRQMTEADIRKIIGDFAQAAQNAHEAGFDGVQIQAAFQYLFAQFLHTDVNIRTDAYGGSAENRARLLFDTLEAVLDRMGGLHVGMKMGPSSDEAGLMAANADTIDTYDYVLNRLNDYPLSHVQIMGTQTDVSATPIASLAGDGMFVHARRIYRGTLIANGGFDFERANHALNEGWADLVAFGQAYIGNPDLVERFRNGQTLSAYDKATAYTAGAYGYTDYPLAGCR